MSIVDVEQDVYLRLVRSFPLLPIASDAELDGAIAVINSLLDKPTLSAGEQGYLDVLSDLVEKYESAEHPMQAVSDADMLRHLLDAKAVSPGDVSRATKIGGSVIADVLAGKRELSRGQISKIAQYFDVEATVFNFDLPCDS